jgi:D-amino peptidase
MYEGGQMSRLNVVALVSALLCSVALAAGEADSLKSNKPKIFISVDMEGIGGVVSQAQTSDAQFDYSRGRKLMTDEVNAAIQGCLDAGAGEIIVADAHGNAQNILPDELNEAALLIRSFPRGLLQMEGVDSTCDGVIFLGYHAKEGTPMADISHTIAGTMIHELKINGAPVSEAVFNAAVAGYFSVPVIMVAGDQNVTQEAAATFRGVECVTTKQSLGWTSAKARHPKLICKEIREKAQVAVRRIPSAQPYVVKMPVTMELTFKNISQAEAVSYLPWVKRLGGKTIMIETPTIIEINRFITALFALGYMR